jgi:nitrogen fixation NifU-like protein
VYSEKYMAHFQAPQNLGAIENPTAKVDVHYKGGGCFDRVRMYLLIKDGVVEDMKYQVRGCSGTIAACSALSSLIKGKSVDDLKHFDRKNVVQALGGIPEKKEHSVDLAMEGLAKLLDACDG